MTNLQKLEKINQQQKRARELYEKKFTRNDWDAKKPEAIKYFEKCSSIVGREVWGI
jgi:hypothetical protein